MSRKQMIVVVAVLAALFAPGIASAQTETAGEAGDAGASAEEQAPDADAGAEEQAPEEPVLEEPFVPDAPPFEDDGAPPPEEIVDGKPFAKGDMEPGVGLGFAGYDGSYYMMIGASFAYYVVNRFAPGLEVTYGTDFGSAEIPDSVTLLPFAKFVILRSPKFAPYLIALGGREFQFNGYNAVHSWIVGAGVGMHIGLGAHVALKIQVTFQHHWFDDPRIRGYEDDRLYKDAEGRKYPYPSGIDRDELATWSTDEWETSDGDPCLSDPEDLNRYVCPVNDKSDLTHEWIFPIISIGMSFSF